MTYKNPLISLIFFLATFFFLNCSDNNWNTEYNKFEKIYSYTEQFHPHKQDLRNLTFQSIKSYLNTLDPHSFFLDPLALRALQEDQEGKFYGIGIRVTKYHDRLTIISALPGTPSYNVGIKAGDLIVEINQQKTNSLSLIQAMELIRGYQTSSVKIKIYRPATKKYFIFNIKRVEIPLNTITNQLIHPFYRHIGYINIETFGKTTPDELLIILKSFSEKHIKGLIIDLRNNTGGSLYAAIVIADYFLNKGEKILSIKGRKTNYTIRAKKNNQFEYLHTAILINRNSASASEILAAALSENNKTTLVGEKSYGKGLVETIYRLPASSAVALTTAKYYTPSGRCLQKSFKLYQNNWILDPKSPPPNEGGVHPDYTVKSETYSSFVSRLISRGIFFDFSRLLINDKTIQISRNFKISGFIIDRFKELLKTSSINFTQAIFDQNIEEIKYEIKRDLMSNKFDINEGIKVFLTRDPASIKATEFLNNSMSG
jgi:carboxyl-terminal processing protease